MLSLEQLLFVASLLLLLSVVASKASGKLGVPALLLFLVIGMLAGSDGPGGISLIFILFSGGLDTNWSHIRPVLGRGLALASGLDPGGGRICLRYYRRARRQRVPIDIMELGLSPGALIVLINRGGTTIVPYGGTILRANDELMVLADEAALNAVQSVIRRKR